MTDTTPAEATVTAEANDTAATPEAEAPALGAHVSYTLSESDVLAINAADPAGNGRNTVRANQIYPATVTAVWSPTCVNLRVHLDGAGPFADYWATSRVRGTDASQWTV